MGELDEALADITQIRNQIARTAQFRGYGPATLAATGVLAFAVAAIQSLWLEHPESEIAAYLALWIAAAVIAVAVVGAAMALRSRRIHSGLAAEMIWAAAEQFAPAGVTGALLMFVLLRFVPQNLWMIPGLWQIVFSLGIFASCRVLPRAAFAVGIWYLTTGLACLAFAGGALAFSPWIMGVPFGVGQLLLAGVILHSHHEVDHAEI